MNNPKDPKHEVLPSDLFMPGKHPNAAKQSDIQALLRLLHREIHQSSRCTTWYRSLTFASVQPIANPLGSSGLSLNDRRLYQEGDGLTRSSLSVDINPSNTTEAGLCAYTSQHFSLSACFWAWWRTQDVPKANPAVAPHLLARKYLRGTQHWVNIPVWIGEELIKQTRGAVLSGVEHLPTVQGACSIPKLLLQDLFDVIDTLKENSSYVPNEVSSQARGLGTMLSFCERMRNVCPKINSYNGPILNSENQQCVTSRDLDEAMLETRHFWFDSPNYYDNAWQPVLELYASAPRWPTIPPPGREVCLSTLLHTKDSAPGPDGIPYSAWRVLPEMTLQAMSSYFYDILEETALPPTQVGVWIPKAKMGPKADNFRPLGMPNTLDRLVDGTVAAHLMHHTAHLLHPSQTVMSYFKEPRAVAEIQRTLDGDRPACALLADLSKAFERVNPHWILHLLRIRGAPRWVLTYARFVLFHRRVMHKVQGRLRPSRTIRQGVDMGRSFSVYLFCFAMDHYLNRIPGVISVQAYVDDTTIAGIASDPKWLHDVADVYRRVASAGFHIDSHSCFRACLNDNMKFPPRLVTTEELLDYWPSVANSCTCGALQEAISGNL